MSNMKQISNQYRESLIKNHPFFCLLTDQEIVKLAELMQEENVNTDTTIVEEGDLVDKIYFIVEGEAQVIRDISTIDKKEFMHISDLKEGDVIGLAHTGLFSTTGIRTAKVKAESPMRLLSIELSKLYTLSSNYPAIKEIIEKFLLMNFIKQTHSFRGLNNFEIRQLAKAIKKIHFSANSQIFQQNDAAIECYFILDGEVDLIDSNTTKTLKKEMFFGEEALSPKSYYESTAVAKTDCDLFQLHKPVIRLFKNLSKKSESKKSLWNFIKQIFS